MLRLLIILLILATSWSPLNAQAQRPAIERALESKEVQRKNNEELMKRFNLSIHYNHENKIVPFLERVRINPQLQAALDEAIKYNVHIFTSATFGVRLRRVYIDIYHKKDDEIIEYIQSSIMVVSEEEKLRKEFLGQTHELGLQSKVDIKKLATFITRINNNPRLKNALQKAKEQNVSIIAHSFFLIGERSITLDITQTDEMILHYLLGDDK